MGRIHGPCRRTRPGAAPRSSRRPVARRPGVESENDVEFQFIQPGKPTQNAFIESFTGRFRDECLNENCFLSIDDARQVIETLESSATRRFRTAPRSAAYWYHVAAMRRVASAP